MDRGGVYKKDRFQRCSEPDLDSEKLNDIYPELKKDEQLFLVHVVERKSEWVKISPGINTFTGWIRKEN